MATIEQRFAEADLNKSLAEAPTTNTESAGEGLATKVLNLQKAREEKLATLNVNKQNIQNNLTQNLNPLNKPVEDVTIVGFQDADTPILSDNRTVREYSPLQNYDATEIEHDVGTWGNIKSALGFGAEKSEKSLDAQKRQAARMLNKSMSAITDQDLLDIGNMQQVQKAADVSQGKGQDRWEAPFVQGVQQTDLTKGFNIPVKMITYGTDSHGRPLAELVNAQTGENITRKHAQDPNMNAQAYANKEYGYKNIDGIRTDTLNNDSLATRTAKAFAAGVGKSVTDFADTGVELVGDVAGRVVSPYDMELGKKLDKSLDLGTEEDKTAYINKKLNYDNTASAQKMNKVQTLYEDATKNVYLMDPSTYSNIDFSKAGEAVKTAFSDLETTGYSLGYMVPALAGLLEKGSLKVMGGATKKFVEQSAEVMKDKTLDAAAKEAKIAELKNGLSGIDKTKLFMAQNADALGYGAMMNNDEMDDFIKANGGEEPTLARMALGTVLDTLGMKLDIHADKEALKGTKGFGEKLIESFRETDKGTATKALGALMDYSSKLALAGIREMPTEYVQEGITAFNKVYGTNPIGQGETSLEDALGPKTREAASVGAIYGLTSGMHMAAPSVSLQATKDLLDSVGTAELVNKLKPNNEEQTNTVGTSVINDSLKQFEDSIANGSTNLDINGYTQFLKDNKGQFDREQATRLNSIFDTYKTNLDKASSKMFKDNGQVDAEILRAHPPIVDELIKMIASKDMTNEQAEELLNTSINQEAFKDYPGFDTEKLKNQLRSIRSNTLETDEALEAFKNVQKDIFERGFLNYSSMVDALQDGSIQDKAAFLGYERGKQTKLVDAINTVEKGINTLTNNSFEALDGLAYLEGLTVINKAKVSKKTESEMILEAAKLMGIDTTNKTYVNIGKEAKAAYEGSQLRKDVNALTYDINDFTRADLSHTNGKFTVRVSDVLADMISGKNTAEDTFAKPQYEKVLNALNQEVDLINRFMNLQEAQTSTKQMFMDAFNNLDTVSQTAKNTVADIIGTLQTQAESVKEQEITEPAQPVQESKIESTPEKKIIEEQYQDIDTTDKIDPNKKFTDKALGKDTIYPSPNEIAHMIVNNDKDGLQTPEVQMAFTKQNVRDVVADEIQRIEKELENTKDTPKEETKVSAVKEDTREIRQSPVNLVGNHLETDRGPYEGRPDQARALEENIKKQNIDLAKEYKTNKEWLDFSYSTLKDLYSQLTPIKGLETEIKELKVKIINTQKELNSTNELIVKLRKEKDKKIADKDRFTLKTIMRKIEAAIRVLGLKIRSLLKKKSELIDTLKQDRQVLKDLESKKLSTIENNKGIKENINKQHEAISEQKRELQGIKEQQIENRKELERIRNAYKANEKSASNARLDSTKNTQAFPGLVKTLPVYTVVNGKAEKVKDKEGKDLKLPALSDVLKVSNGIAPLAVVSNYEQLLDKSKLELLNKYRDIVTEVENLVKQSTNETKMTIVKNGNATNIQWGTDKLAQSIMAFRAPALSVLFNDKNLNTNKNALVALDAATKEWLSTDAIAKNELTAKDVARYYGIDEVDVDSDKLETFREKGIPIRFLAEKIGGKVLSHLGYTTDTSHQEAKEVVTRLKESLGTYGIKLAEKRGFLTVTETEFIPDASLSTEENTKEDTENKGKQPLIVKAVVFNNKAKSVNEKEFAQVKSELGLTETIKGPSFKRPSLASIKNNIRRNELTVIPSLLLEAKKDASLLEWHLKGIDGDSAIAEMFELDRSIVKSIMGYQTAEEIKALPKTLRQGAESKNRQIARSVDSIFDMHNLIVNKGEEINSFWFNYYTGKNLRLYVDSEGLNNQSDKMHRSLVYTDGQVTEIKKGSKEEQVFKLGIAQAFGYDIDKSTVQDSIKYGETVLKNHKEVEAGWKKVKEGSKVFTLNGEKIKVKELGHLLDGIQAVRDYTEANGHDFSTKLLVESDAVTSGFALKMLQIIGDLNKGFGGKTTAKEWLEKVGIFVDDTTKELLGNKNIVDGYKTLGSHMTPDNIEKVIEDIVEKGKERQLDQLATDLGLETTDNKKEVINQTRKIIDLFEGVLGKLVDDKGEVSKLARDLFKPPFMTFMYGAGFTKIKKELAAMVIDKVLDKVAEAKGTPNKDLTKLLNFITGKNGYDIFMNEDIKTYKPEGSMLTVYETMEQRIVGTFGNTVEKTMKKEFASIIEINTAVREVTNAVFQVWNKKFKEKLVNEEGLTLDNVDQLAKDLIEDFPIIKGPLSTSIKDGIAIFKTELSRGLESMFINKYEDAGGYFATNKDGIQKLSTLGINHIIRLYKEAATAAGVIPIHTLDSAAINMAVMGKDVQQIFDAIMGGIGNITSTAKDYNKTIFDLSMKWDFLTEVLNLAQNTIGKEESKKYLDEYLQEKNDESLAMSGNPYGFTGFINTLITTSNANKVFKEEFKAKSSKIEHMVFNGESAYIHKPEGSNIDLFENVPVGVKNTINKEIKDKLGMSLEQLIAECK